MTPELTQVKLELKTALVRVAELEAANADLNELMNQDDSSRAGYVAALEGALRLLHDCADREMGDSDLDGDPLVEAMGAAMRLLSPTDTAKQSVTCSEALSEDDEIIIPEEGAPSPCGDCGEWYCDHCTYKKELAVVANPCKTCKGTGLGTEGNDA